MVPERKKLFDELEAAMAAELAAESEWNDKAQAAKDSAEAAAKLIQDANNAEAAAAAVHAESVAASEAAYRNLRGN